MFFGTFRYILQVLYYERSCHCVLHIIIINNHSCVPRSSSVYYEFDKILYLVILYDLCEFSCLHACDLFCKSKKQISCRTFKKYISYSLSVNRWLLRVEIVAIMIIELGRKKVKLAKCQNKSYGSSGYLIFWIWFVWNSWLFSLQ